MKEAAGEANMTVVTIVLIAIVLGVGTLIVTRLVGSMTEKSCCTDAGGVWEGGQCTGPNFDTTTYNACIGEVEGTSDNNTVQ